MALEYVLSALPPLLRDGTPRIRAATARGSMIASIDEDGMYMFDTSAGLCTCDPDGSRDAINNTVREALNDAREEQS